MNDFVEEFTLDLNCKATPTVINAGQYDVGRKYIISIYANGVSFDVSACTAVCKGVRRDKTHFAVNCTVDNNKVILITDESVLLQDGMTVAKIVLSDGSKTYSTQKFVIVVGSAFDGDISSVDSYSVLNKLIQKVYALSESGAIILDDEIDSNSNNAVQNSAIAIAFAEKESLSNKITEMTDNDGDGDYPTSNAVKNYLEGNYYDADDSENVFQSKLYAGENITIGSVQGKAVISADLSGKADKDEVYKKTDIDTKLNEKADKSTTYTKTEADAKLDDKENISNKTASISKSCTDEQYPTAKAVYQKLSKVYTKAEVNGLYGLKLAVGYNSNDVPVKIAGNSTISAGNFASDEIVKIYVGFTQGIIQNGAFTACPNLTDIYFYNVETAYSIANNAVPDGVTVHFAVAFNNIECITKAVCNFKTAKYDSSNIEEGNATLTAYTGQGDNIKSASCIYQRIGGFVTVNAAVVFNAVTLNANSSIHLINLPYRNAWDTPMCFTGISSKNAVFKGSLPKSSTWLSMMYATPKAYTFTDGEQLNFTLIYKI